MCGANGLSWKINFALIGIRISPNRRERLGLRKVGSLPRRDRQRDGIAERIDDGVDLGRQAAARAADGLVFAIFF